MAAKFWLDRPVLVTGCTGLVGSWLTKRLLEQKAQVIGLVRDWVPQSNLILQKDIDRIVTVRGSVEDQALIERVLNEYEIDTVFHLAAQTIVGTADRSPLSTFETNIKGTWTLLEACRHLPKVTRIVVASSDKAYGEQKSLPYTEETPLEGRQPYEVSKSCADLISLSYHASYGLPVCVTRCGNFYGGGDLNFNRIVPGTIRSLFRGDRPVIRSDGKSLRDYVYVEDAAALYMHLAEKMSDRRIHGMAFNFSGEKPARVLDIVKAISAQMNAPKALNPIIQNGAANEIRHQYLNCAKAKKTLGWSSQFSQEEGLRRTIEWYRWFFSQEETGHD